MCSGQFSQLTGQLVTAGGQLIKRVPVQFDILLFLTFLGTPMISILCKIRVPANFLYTFPNICLHLVF